ncbi:MAG: hypothetical protein R3E48_08525 [Burkholderiaceae bacterium]
MSISDSAFPPDMDPNDRDWLARLAAPAVPVSDPGIAAEADALSLALAREQAWAEAVANDWFDTERQAKLFERVLEGVETAEWLARLADSGAPIADPNTAAEADALRAALMREQLAAEQQANESFTSERQERMFARVLEGVDATEWLQRLANPKAQVSSPDVADEAEALAGALQREQARAESDVERGWSPDRQQRVLERVLDEAFPTAQATPAAPLAKVHAPDREAAVAPSVFGRLFGWFADFVSPSGALGWGGPVAVAATVIIAVAVVYQGIPVETYYDAPPKWMGAGKAPIELVDKAPKSRADQIAKAFANAGLAARLYQHGDVFYVDFDVPPESVDEAADLMKGLGIAPDSGQFRVAVRRP